MSTRTEEITDRDLLLRHRAGDAEAFAAVYDRYAAGLLFYLRSRTGDAALAEDLLQDCFLRLLNVSPFELRDSVQNLLFVIARNLALDEGRRSSLRSRSAPRLVPAPGAPAEDLEPLARALQELPEEQRDVVVLKFHAGLTFARIAEVVEVPEPTVKSRYRYALSKLAELLKGDA